MNDEKDKREGQARTPASHSKKDSRQDRLKLALRENLKRRKSQARGRGDIVAASSAEVDVALHDECEKKPLG